MNSNDTQGIRNFLGKDGRELRGAFRCLRRGNDARERKPPFKTIHIDRTCGIGLTKRLADTFRINVGRYGVEGRDIARVPEDKTAGTGCLRSQHNLLRIRREALKNRRVADIDPANRVPSSKYERPAHDDMKRLIGWNCFQLRLVAFGSGAAPGCRQSLGIRGGYPTRGYEKKEQ
nr:hypothetical protein [Granulicella sibirica]